MRVPGRALAELALRRDPNPGISRALLHGLYDLAWLLVAVLVSPILLWKGLRNRRFGRGVLERLGLGLSRAKRRGDRPRVLVHGVSVGEVKGAQPVVLGLERDFPGYDVFVCTSTDTGTEVAGQLFRPERVLRFPADISFVVRRFLKAARPELVVLIELEIWPNFLRECNRLGIPVVVVNGRITSMSHTNYMLFRDLLPQFNRISFFCVQSEEYADRFRRLNVPEERLLITGNIKADGLGDRSSEPTAEIARLLGARPDQTTIVAGSTHEPEELTLALACRDAVPEARLVIVPRHPPRCPELLRELSRQGFQPQLLTRLRSGDEIPDPARPALVDTIGELEDIYALADVVFVGGSLIPHGGQNMLEPAAQGKAIVFGPHVSNFLQEAALLLEAGACLQLEETGDLANALSELARDGSRRARMGQAARTVVEAQKGATQRTLLALAELGLGGDRMRPKGSPSLESQGEGD